MKNILKKNQEAFISTFTSILSILLAIISNTIYENIRTFFSLPVWTLAVLIILDIFLFFNISKCILVIKKKIFSNESDNIFVQQAFLSMKSLAHRQGEYLQQTLSNNDIDNKVLSQISYDKIKQIVEQCFNFFDNTFSNNHELVNTINFEVTFMTKSYIDDEITIPAASNKEHTQPRSMLKRKNDPSTYNQTETAKIYEEYKRTHNVKIHVIPKTTMQNDYYFLYEGQSNRIRSSIVLPIVSHSNELLGTLVVHCNKDNFFEIKKEKFWKEILDIFAVEISNEKLFLDLLMKKTNENKIF